MALPQDTSTIEALVLSGRSVAITYENLAFLERASNGTLMAIRNVIWDYIDELKNASVMIKLSDAEYRKYKFKPKLLCYDMYGNTEVDFVILAINDIADMTEFSSNTFRMLKTKDMNDILSLIYNAESKSIELFNSATEVSG